MLILHDLRVSTDAIGFNIDNPVERGNVKGEPPWEGISSGNELPGETTLPIPLFLLASSRALTPMSASAYAPISTPAPAAPGCTSGYIPLHAAVIRSHATRKNWSLAIARNQRNSSNTSAAIAEHFRPATMCHFHGLRIFNSGVPDVEHQIDYRGTFSVEYTYATKHLDTSCSRRGENELTPNTFEEASKLPKAAYWKKAVDERTFYSGEARRLRANTNFLCHFVTKGSRCSMVKNKRADGTFKCPLVLQGWSQVPGMEAFARW